MFSYKKILKSSVALLFILGALDASSDESNLYLGAGLGVGNLDPNLSGTNYSVKSENDLAIKFSAGWDINKRISIEGFYSDLGYLELAPSGKLGYSSTALAGLYHFYLNERPRQAGNISAHFKAGASYLWNQDKDGVDSNKQSDALVLLGVGVEYFVFEGLSVRAEYESFAKDAYSGVVSLIKRFGLDKPQAAPTPEPVDSDGDGLFDNEDDCPNTPVGVSINEKGCAKFEGVLTNIQFDLDSADLTESSKVFLDSLLEDFKVYSTLKLKLVAHTDATGTEQYNYKLSEERADTVKHYLVSQGVSAERLETQGKGKSQPIADNSTQEGRAKNRRVEFLVLQR